MLISLNLNFIIIFIFQIYYIIKNESFVIISINILKKILQNIEKKDSPCAKLLERASRGFILFFLSKRCNEYRQKSPSHQKSFILHRSLLWATYHPSWLSCDPSNGDLSFFLLWAERREGNSISRKLVLGSRAQWYGRSAEKSRMRRFLYVDGL